MPITGRQKPMSAPDKFVPQPPAANSAGTPLSQPRARAAWVSRKEIPFFCLDFSGFRSDPAGLTAEIRASEAVIAAQAPHSLLLAIDLHRAGFAPDLIAYLRILVNRSPNPVRRVAVIGLSGWRRRWLALVKHIEWPRNAAFFDDWETGKAWLIGERQSHW